MQDFQTKVKVGSQKGNSTVNMNFRSEFTQTSYELFDTQGRAIKNGEITSDRTTIDLAGLPKEKYIILVLDGNRLYIQNFELG
ncbi:MAG TPA: hypothetical protein VJ894_02810 [Cryomorphaceae bacterium]|nr:hypothetical protein [Cryomorphaceae bacterium]